MKRYEEFTEKAEKLIGPHKGKHTAFWFNVDFVEFRMINYYYGREKGNALLEETQAYLNGLPEVKLSYRIFSDQFFFIMITDEPKSGEEVKECWDSRAAVFLREQQEKYPECNLRLRCGICCVENETAEECADNASMAHKASQRSSGYDTVLYTPNLMENLELRQKKEMEIHQALQEDRFVYYLQPIVELRTGKIVAAEALAREKTPDGSILLPDSFQDIMEETGDMVQLDYLILRKVCRDLAERLRSGRPVVRTAVNLSKFHVHDPHSAEKLHDVVRQYGLEPKYVDFELTEAIPMMEYANAKVMVDQLRSFGYRVSIDDYGAGYTGVAVWQDLDFDVLKMDRKFLSGDEEEAVSPKNRILIQNTLDIANEMNIQVIFEGVEHAEQCSWLVQWGGHNAQGFCFSHAVPPEEFYRDFEEKKGAYPLHAHVEFVEK